MGPDLRLAGPDLPRVLICDEVSESVSFLQDLLSSWGIEVVSTKNSSDALEILRQNHPPKIVIIDVSLNGMDFCHALRTEPRDYYPYVLMTAATNLKAAGELALHSGADDFLPKPFDAFALLARLSVASRFLSLQDNLIHAREELRTEATKDSLTSLFNRAAVLDLFQRELDRALLSRSHTGFLLIDLDHFKKINDEYGHACGDEVLREVARRIKHCVRSYDFVGRYGGEEFCAVLSNCSRISLQKRAEQIRAAIGKEPISFGSATLTVSASVGATVVFANSRSAEETVAVADVALYRAKNLGRDRTICCLRRLSMKSMAGQDMKRICAACNPRFSTKCSANPVLISGLVSSGGAA